MRRRTALAGVAWCALLAGVGVAERGARAEEPDATKQWGNWRGPLNTGVAPHGDPPIEWSEGKNIKWKIATPGLGHSSPIVWGDTVYLTTAIPFGDAIETPQHEHHHPEGAHDNLPASRQMKFALLAIDRNDGSVRWERTLRTERPHEGVHETGSWASNSPVTDGEHLFASFGSRGLFCLDMTSKVVWEKDLGDMQTRHGHGEGSSPALYKDSLIVNWDHQGDSFIVALDKRTGTERWRVARDEITSWSTPLVVEHGDGAQVIVAATNRTRGYDLRDGRAIWECGGLSRNVVASPVAKEGLVIVANSYDWQAMLAIRLDKAKGDITGTEAVAWKLDRLTPYVPSPLLYDDQLYFLRHLQPTLSCVAVSNGKAVFGPVRLPPVGNIFASPVGAAGRVYIASRDGHTLVVRHGAKYEPLADNVLDDSFSASPAIVGGELFLRGEKHMYCIARPGAE